MEKDIGKIQKGEFQGTVTEIVVGIREYNGKVGVDIREFVTSEKYTGPTKKGLRIPAESFQDFRKMIDSIAEEDLKAAEVPAEQPATEEVPAENPEQEELPDY